MTTLKIKLLLAGAVLLCTLAYLFNMKLENSNDPCPLADTADLTGYTKFDNGSYLYEGLIIPPHLLGLYAYTINETSHIIPAQPHVRGCTCKLRPCVKLCCTLNETFIGDGCYKFSSGLNPHNQMNITTSSLELRKVDITEKFSIQIGSISECIAMYYLVPHWDINDNFSLFENGTLQTHDEYLSKDQYCLGYYEMDNKLFPSPMICGAFEPEDQTRANVSAITMLISVPFFILTVIVYMALPELRTLHGKSLCCYLLGLSFWYTLLAVIILIPESYLLNIECKMIGYLTYFSFMASFGWLGVISFDLYYNIRAPRGKYNEKKRFIFYSIFAWSFALILLGLFCTADMISIIPDDWKPKILDNKCWLNGRTGWTAMIYLYVPVLIVIAFSIVMFILTSLQIYGVQKEISRIMERNDSQKNLRNEKDKFGVFFRLFIIMGVSWCLDIIPYLTGNTTSWTAVHYVCDFILGVQGILIFVLFVLKKNVKGFINKRFQIFSHQSECHSQDSTKTQASNANITLKELGSYKPIKIEGI